LRHPAFHGTPKRAILPATWEGIEERAARQAERDMMEEVRAGLFKQVREGDGPKDVLEGGVLKGLPRTWKDPEKFLYDAAKGLWAHRRGATSSTQSAKSRPSAANRGRVCSASCDPCVGKSSFREVMK
jgi:hypothetical protein